MRICFSAAENEDKAAMKMIIAIDGPAGSGKSTVAKMISQKYRINYMDTGAMYRAFALALINMGIDISDHDAVRAVLEDINVTVGYCSDGQHVYVDGRDVTGSIRTPEVSKGASDVAVIPEVRIKLVKTQRETAEMYDIVMDGRDIGSYVLPDAPLKIYLTASSDVRAQRRQKQLAQAGISKDFETLRQEITDRDKTDSTREFAPLMKAEDAVLIDTSDMDIQEVIAAIEEKIEKVFS